MARIISFLVLKNTILKYYSYLECIIPEANIAMFISPWTHVLFLISWENVSLFLLEDKQNVMCVGVV